MGSKDDRRAVTLKEVAGRVGVSRSTVSLVLRESPLVAEATRVRVREAISDTGYIYNRGAARLRTGLSGTVGLIVPEITNPFYARLTAGIDDVFDREGRLTFLANSDDRPERQARFIGRIREQGVDGIILCAATGTPMSLAAAIRAWGTPFVEILRSIDGMAADFVAPDFRKGTRLAVDHLAGAGHQRIALLASARDHSATRERVEAFGDALQRHDLPVGAVLPCSADGATATGCLNTLLERPEPPSAIICHNDLMALGLMRAMRDRGLAPGRDLRIVGFDDIPEALNAMPQLTTVATGPFEVGTIAAGLLLRRIQRLGGKPECILVEPRLMVRGT